MLSEMGVSHLREWMALAKIEQEDRLREEAAFRVEGKLGARR
jgi:hypothetical protein